MPSIVVAIAEKQLSAFREMLETHDLVDVIAEKSTTSAQGPQVLFTLDAGLGNAINYFWLGRAWAAIVREQEEPKPLI